MRDAVAAMMVAGPVRVVDGEVWGWMRAEGTKGRRDEGIWGAAETLRKTEEPEVRRRMLEGFGHKVVWLTKGMEQWRRGVYRYPTAIVSEYIEIGKYKNN